MLISYDADVPEVAEVTPLGEVAEHRHGAVTHDQREPGEQAAVTDTAQINSSLWSQSSQSATQSWDDSLRTPDPVSEPVGQVSRHGSQPFRDFVLDYDSSLKPTNLIFEN